MAPLRRPDWHAFDALMRELGSLRVAAVAHNAAAVGAAVTRSVDILIAQAAEAVDRVIDDGNDETLVSAWESILLAREYIDSLRDTADHSRQIVLRSVGLRKRAADAMARATLLREGRSAR